MIGAGVFIQPSYLASFGWTAVAAWGVAIPGAILLAYVLSRLLAARPTATGPIAIVSEGLGAFPGLLVGWSYWISICSANAIIALTAVRYGGSFTPMLTSTPLATALGATALIWALTILNLTGAKEAGRFQVLTTLLKIMPLVAVVLILIGLVATDGARFSANAHTSFNAGALTTALTLTFFPLIGFEAASLAAKRVRDPARNILRATLFGTAFTGLLYLIVSIGVIFSLSEAKVAASNAPIALFVETFWGRGAGLAIAAFASIAAIGCLNGWTLMLGEVPFGMARSGLVPAFLARTNARDVPFMAILMSSSFSTILVMSSAHPSFKSILTFMLQLTTAATVWLYVGACAAAIALRIARPAAACGLAFCAWVLGGAGIEPLLLSIALMLTAVPLYWLRPRKPINRLDPSSSAEARSGF
jgi:basic amino acid/polyamine antiporter, APA family